ncbi:MAG: metal-dependent hydrolase [Planctomycetota bacterium]
MNPITHFLVGWLTANSCELSRKERTLVTIAGIIPDIDSFGIIAEPLTSHWERPLMWWSEYHHVLAHNIGFCLLMTGIGFLAAAQKWKTAFLVFLSFHLHLLGDLLGGRGPEGYSWPIPYLLPFSDAWPLTWSGQWELNAWPNFVITGLGLMATFYLAWKRGYSPIGLIFPRVDDLVIKALRTRFPQK